MYKRERVKGYEEYEVDTNGIVYSKKGRPLKYSHNHRGYQIVNFYVNRKRKGYAVHTLVAKQFISNDDPRKTQVNHLDGNKDNNSVCNLEWTTPLDNVRHSIFVLGKNNVGKNNVNAKRVMATNVENISDVLIFDSLADAARKYLDLTTFKTAQGCIWRVLKGKRRSYRGYYWKYI